MEVNCEAVEMADVQWTEVRVECIVEEGIINGEVHRSLTPDRLRSRWSLISRGPFAW